MLTKRASLIVPGGIFVHTPSQPLVNIEYIVNNIVNINTTINSTW